jgi:hypothetical protein
MLNASIPEGFTSWIKKVLMKLEVFCAKAITPAIK